jgi:hypothetical protein
MGRIAISRKKESRRVPDMKDAVRTMLPKPKYGILNEEEKTRLFEYLKSLKESSGTCSE